MMNIVTGRGEHEAKTEREIEQMLNGEPEVVTDFYLWMKHSSHTKSFRTQYAYVYEVIRFLDYVGKSYDQIAPRDIIRYIDHESKRGKRDADGKASGSYLVQIYSAIKKFYLALIAMQMIDKNDNPIDGVERPAPKKSDEVVRKFLTKEEVAQCFEVVAKEKSFFRERDTAILTILFCTGIRNSALTEINIDNIDFSDNSIWVVDKGDKSRQCWITAKQMDAVRTWCSVREAVLEGKSEEKALFIGLDGKRLSQQSTATVVRKISKQIGHEISPHKCRGTLATVSHDSGMSLEQISVLLNHSNMRTTKDCYIKENLEHKKRDALQAAGMFSF